MGRRQRDEHHHNRDTIIDKVLAIVLEVATESIPGKAKAHAAAKQVARMLDDATHTGPLEPFDNLFFRMAAFALVEIAYRLLKAEGVAV